MSVDAISALLAESDNLISDRELRAAPFEEKWAAEGIADRKSRWPDTGRLDVAFRLAEDLDTCERLLAGYAVDPDRIDRRELERAKTERLVQLVRPLDLLVAA